MAYFGQSRPHSLRFVKKHDKKICKKFLGLGCFDKTASENDFNKGSGYAQLGVIHKPRGQLRGRWFNQITFFTT